MGEGAELDRARRAIWWLKKCVAENLKLKTGTVLMFCIVFGLAQDLPALEVAH